ncbi:MAG: FGGY family carbohydrate kinase [Actinomycetota bacterium]
MELVVGVDMATAAVRIVAIDGHGCAHAQATGDLPAPTSPRPGWREQDAGAWWPTVATVLRQLTQELGARARSIRALSVSSTSGTVAALGAGMQPLGPALTYADQRGVAQAQAAAEADAQRWAGLGLRIQPSFGLVKWAWLMGRPEIAERTVRLAHASDVVVGRLIGELPPSDYSHALKSGFDPLRMEWAAGALEKLGIPQELLPPIAAPASVAGTLCAQACESTGLPPGCEVRLGMTDACAAQLAAGAGEPGRFVSVIGSTLVLKGVSTELIKDPSGAVYSHRHPDGWWLPGGASSAGAGALTHGFADANLARLDELADARGPATVVTYPLVATGERFPFVEPDAVSFTVGTPADEVERYRAILEGVAFVERLGYERLAALGAEAKGSISSAGGGSASAVWTRIRASVLGKPIVQKPGASTARGAAILAAAGSLHPDLASATQAMSVDGTEVAPEPAEQDALERNFQRLSASLVDHGWLGAG